MFPRKIGMITTVFATLAFCVHAKADWTDNFDGGFQQSWNFGNVNGANGVSGTFQAASVNDTLVLTDPNPVATGGAAIGFGWVDEQFANVTVSGTINPLNESNLNGFVGLLARANLATLSGYVLTYNPITGSADLVRAENGGETSLGDVNIGAQTDSLFASLTVFGNQVSGQLFDAEGGTLLAELSAVDTAFSTGVSGVVVQFNDGSLTTPLRGTWDNVSSVTAIPEPSSLLFLGLAGSAIAYRRRNRRSCRTV